MDREKVIELVERIIILAEDENTRRSWDSDDVGWKNTDRIWDSAQQLKELLKEHEAVALKPHYIDKYGKNFICGVECGNCGVEISATYKFCPYCGRSVKWE